MTCTSLTCARRADVSEQAEDLLPEREPDFDVSSVIRMRTRDRVSAVR